MSLKRKGFLLIFIVAGQLVFAQAKSYKIIVMGDNRQPSYYGEQTIAARKTMEMIVAEKPDYVFHTGDFIRGYDNDLQVVKDWYSEWLDLMAPVRKILYVAPGNHDIWSQESLELYRQKIGKTYYSMDVGPAHMIVLNAWFPDQQNQITGEQLQWLEKDLAAAQDHMFRFVFIHPPAYPTGPHKGSSLDEYPKMRDQFWALLEKYKVDIMFCGHEHLYNDHTYGTVRQIITGGAGADLYGTVKQGAFYHYLRLIIHPDTYEVETVKVEDPLSYALKNLKKRKKASKAIPMLESIRNEFPESDDIYAYLGIAYEKVKDTQTADSYFDQYLKRRHYNERAFHFLLDEMDKYKAADRALEVVERGAKKYPDSLPISIIYARQLALSGNPEQGLQKLTKLLNQNPGNPEITFYIGVAYEHLAAKYYRQVVKKSPKNPLARQARKRIKSTSGAK